jgi:uncharacterized protein (TIGR02246 family)
MHPFHVEGMTPEAFVDRVRRDLEGRGFDRFVTVRRNDDQLVVRFSWMGSSVLRYRLVETGSGFRAEPDGHRIASLHRPFVEQFEDRFEHVLESVGAAPVFRRAVRGPVRARARVGRSGPRLREGAATAGRFQLREDVMEDRFARLFDAIDARDAERFAGFLTEDVVFVYGSGDPVAGRGAVRDHVAGFFAAFDAIEHRVAEVWRPEPEVAVMEGRVRYRRHDGAELEVPFVNVLRLRDGAVRDYRIYVDPSPLAGAAG